LKASELAEKVVSKELADALNREFKALGVGTLKVSLHSRSDKGKALHKLSWNFRRVAIRAISLVRASSAPLLLDHF